MISLGLDLSLTATGTVRLKDGKMIDKQLIKTKPSIGSIGELNRLTKIRDAINTKDVDIAVIEGLAFMARNSTALCQLAGLNYLVREKLFNEGIKFVIVAPSSLKKFITGKGNCPKDLMLLEIYKRYGMSFSDDNESDAFALAKIGEALLNKSTKLTKFQEEVIGLVQTQ